LASTLRGRERFAQVGAGRFGRDLEDGLQPLVLLVKLELQLLAALGRDLTEINRYDKGAGGAFDDGVEALRGHGRLAGVTELEQARRLIEARVGVIKQRQDAVVVVGGQAKAELFAGLLEAVQGVARECVGGDADRRGCGQYDGRQPANRPREPARRAGPTARA